MTGGRAGVALGLALAGCVAPAVRPPVRLRTDAAIVRAPASVPDAAVAEAAAAVAEGLARCRTRLGVAPVPPLPVELSAAPLAAALPDGAPTLAEGLHTGGAIRAHAAPWLAITIRHEVAHAAVAVDGEPEFPTWLHEAIALDIGDAAPATGAAALAALVFDTQPNLPAWLAADPPTDFGALDRAWAGGATARGNALARSVAAFVHARGGPAALGALVRGWREGGAAAAWPAAVGLAPDAAGAAWASFVAQVGARSLYDAAGAPAALRCAGPTPAGAAPTTPPPPDDAAWRPIEGAPAPGLFAVPSRAIPTRQGTAYATVSWLELVVDCECAGVGDLVITARTPADGRCFVDDTPHAWAVPEPTPPDGSVPRRRARLVLAPGPHRVAWLVVSPPGADAIAVRVLGPDGGPVLGWHAGPAR